MQKNKNKNKIKKKLRFAKKREEVYGREEKQKTLVYNKKNFL